ncbi:MULTISPECIES: hypothetical protein [Burkholderia]|uniref:hypothetical protein n=1 Tax=Burkholderia TaxID=32008 RepID=UPI000A40A828|nr:MULTISPECIES: hypothetical protein [Burkholderia]
MWHIFKISADFHRGLKPAIRDLQACRRKQIERLCDVLDEPTILKVARFFDGMKQILDPRANLHFDSLDHRQQYLPHTPSRVAPDLPALDCHVPLRWLFVHLVALVTPAWPASPDVSCSCLCNKA